MVLYGVVLSLVLTTIVIMTQQLRKPIDWLAESLSLIAEGNFKSLRPYRRNDEFTPFLNLWRRSPASCRASRKVGIRVRIAS